MPRDRNDPVADQAWLLDMVEAARAVQAFIAGRTFEQYASDLFFRSAVERQVEIIGEAARGISETFKDAHPEIPWRQIMAQRHRLAHEYGEIDDAIIWAVATVHIPRWIIQLDTFKPKPVPPTDSESNPEK
jgi:uncharacterized protein with HEPN domain